jgi:hypothetical protein
MERCSLKKEKEKEKEKLEVESNGFNNFKNANFKRKKKQRPLFSDKGTTNKS